MNFAFWLFRQQNSAFQTTIVSEISRNFAPEIKSKRKYEAIRSVLESSCKDISIMNFETISSSILKRCENGEGLLVTPLSWVKTHPLLKTADMDWSFEIPYGILFSRFPSAKVKKLTDIISVY